MSLLGALDAVVGAHGAMQWEIAYCRPDLRFKYALLSLHTTDREGLGRSPIYQIDGNGRRNDACRDK